MHRVLESLPLVHAECARTDALATSFGLKISTIPEAVDPWGYDDVFVRPGKANQELPVWLSRDVILMPTVAVEHDYDLGFEEDWEPTGSKMFVCYRLEHVILAKGGSTNQYKYPVTVYCEFPNMRWRISSRVVDQGKRRPKVWTDLLNVYRMSQFGEAAQGISARRAYRFIESMMRIASSHGQSRHARRKVG